MRSRAAFKLMELNDKYHLLRKGMRVVDLGSAPGSWTQVAQQALGDTGQIMALDILPMEPIDNVTIIQGDFRENDVFEELMNVMQDGNIENAQADLVISDMAPNISGMGSVDMPRAYYLCELVLDLARQVLKPGGGLLVKLFQGEGFEAYNKELKSSFSKVVMRKPKASRARSREIYALATGFLGNGS